MRFKQNLLTMLLLAAHIPAAFGQAIPVRECRMKNPVESDARLESLSWNCEVPDLGDTKLSDFRVVTESRFLFLERNETPDWTKFTQKFLDLVIRYSDLPASVKSQFTPEEIRHTQFGNRQLADVFSVVPADPMKGYLAGATFWVSSHGCVSKDGFDLEVMPNPKGLYAVPEQAPYYLALLRTQLRAQPTDCQAGYGLKMISFSADEVKAAIDRSGIMGNPYTLTELKWRPVLRLLNKLIL
jgi:hypothetical protein